MWTSGTGKINRDNPLNMARTNQLHLICYDEHRTYPEEMKKRFADPDKYRISLVVSQKELLKQFEADTDKSKAKVAVMVLSELNEIHENIESVARDIKRSSPCAGVMLVCPGEKIEGLRKISSLSFDDIIPKNDNSVLRLHNAVKKYVSAKNLDRMKKHRNISLIVLLAFIFLAALGIIIARVRYPVYF